MAISRRDPTAGATDDGASVNDSTGGIGTGEDAGGTGAGGNSAVKGPRSEVQGMGADATPALGPRVRTAWQAPEASPLLVGTLMVVAVRPGPVGPSPHPLSHLGAGDSRRGDQQQQCRLETGESQRAGTD